MRCCVQEKNKAFIMGEDSLVDTCCVARGLVATPIATRASANTAVMIDRPIFTITTTPRVQVLRVNSRSWSGYPRGRGPKSVYTADRGRREQRGAVGNVGACAGAAWDHNRHLPRCSCLRSGLLTGDRCEQCCRGVSVAVVGIRDTAAKAEHQKMAPRSMVFMVIFLLGDPVELLARLTSWFDENWRPST